MFEVLAGDDVGLERPLHVLVLRRMRTAQPVAVAHPELAPLERRLDVVIEREALFEQGLRVASVALRGGRECRDPVGGGFLVAIAQFATVAQAELGLVMRLIGATQQQEALGAPTAQLGHDVALRDQRERLGEDLVIELERRLGLLLLEMNVAEELGGEEGGAGVGLRHVPRFS